jgi:hypothetical protein
MAENLKNPKLKGSDTDTETAAQQRTRRLQQGAGKEGPIDDSIRRDEEKRPDHKTSRG